MPSTFNSLLYPGLLTGAFGNPMSGMGQLDPYEQAMQARMPYERPDVFRDLPEEYRKSAQQQAIMQLAAALGSAPKGYLGGALASGTLGYMRERQGQLESFQNRYDDQEQRLGLDAYRKSLIENQKRARDQSERTSLQKHFSAIAERSVAAKQIQSLNLPSGEAEGLLARLDAGENAYQVLKAAQDLVRDREEEERKRVARETGIEAAVRQGIPRGLAELSAGDTVGEGLVGILAGRQGFQAPSQAQPRMRYREVEQDGKVYVIGMNVDTGVTTEPMYFGPAGDDLREEALRFVLRDLNNPLMEGIKALDVMERRRKGEDVSLDSTGQIDWEDVTRRVDEYVEGVEKVVAPDKNKGTLFGASTGSTSPPEPISGRANAEADPHVTEGARAVDFIVQGGHTREDAFEVWFRNSGLPESQRETLRRRIFSLLGR